MTRLPRRGLYAITGAGLAGTALQAAVRRAVAGGAVMVQYRAKEAATPEDAAAVQRICAEAGVPLIVNDDPALANRVGAAGVHLGRDDATVAQARQTLGKEAILGVSCYDSLERAQAAIAQGADYVAFGRFFPSRTKHTAVNAPLPLLTRARAVLKVPIVAIGGITPDNGAGLIAAGADLLAVVEGVFGDIDPQAAARRYAGLFSPCSNGQDCPAGKDSYG